MEEPYEKLRDDAIIAYKKIYKDSLAFDIAMIPKDARIRLLSDEVYIKKTKQLKAELYAKQLKTLDDILRLEYSDPDKGNATEILKALEMKDRLLFKDLNIDADESNALNIVFIQMDENSFNNISTIDIVKESSNQSNKDFDVSDIEEVK